ncbi:vascular endothelial growth factor receptor 3 isoform X2 [Exaiptasia diaphana]|uniref:Receptor protein-tyrosine kinase n=1 Tax=Exaiptasia diaphana TaxID=2652724 RepID=A0A913YPV9_EXADI|nr:vascular endothelial growth factor receptor 3 isoform X2 [Exaiptasia diaphana]
MAGIKRNLQFFFSSGKYLVCDTTEKQEPKSWLRTDFIEFNGAKRVFIYISYTIRKCKSISRYCKEHFKLYAAQTSKSALSPKPPNGFEEIAIAQPQNLKDGVPYERDVIVLNATIKAKMGGFYLAFLDQGVCLTLYSIKVMFYFCPEYYPDLVKFPRTISPAEDIVGSQGQVHGSCSDSNAKSTSKLLGVCTTKGVWKTNASCLCKPGYEYLTHPRRRCKVCGFDQYKSSLDNSRCKTCPVGSYPFAQKTECRCNSGFFRINEKDNEPCYAPSGPVTLDEKKGSYSKTTIVPASGIGGTLAPSGPVTLDEKKGSYSKTTIVASGIGGTLGLLFVIALLVCYLVNRRQKKLLKMQYKAMKYLRGDEDSKFDPNRSILEQCEELPYDADWEFPVKRLILQGVIGSGAFGQVMKAEAVGILSFSAGDKKSIALKRRLKLRRRLMFNHIFQDSAGNDCTRTTVAVKMLKAEANESDYKDLAIELKIMIHLGEHSNIINLLGACTRSEQLMVIMEFAPHGNLLNFLRSRREIYEATWRKTANNPDAEFTLADLVMFSYQIARGMDFLSSKKCVHRDLAARNVLVGEDYVMKIADFGLARDIYKSDLYVKETTGLLPLKWMAPESLFDRVYTLKTDM